MNQQIEQLAEQCWVHTNEPLFAAKSPHWEFDRQKFAELIVQQCAMKANAVAIDLRNDSDLDARKYVGDSILKAFGVEP